jgi:hypothetical protein
MMSPVAAGHAKRGSQVAVPTHGHRRPAIPVQGELAVDDAVATDGDHA